MKPLIVANWKMNPETLAEAKRNFEIIKKGVKTVKKVESVICVPFIFLSVLKPTNYLKLGAQDCFWEEKGAYTGEVSPQQLKNLGVKYVILGHSERRKYLKETDEMAKKKVKACLGKKLNPVLCIENLSQLKEVSRNTIVAFEPVFAIGTGKPYSVGKAKRIRKRINNNFVLYGGSVNSQNAKDYVEKAGFQGLLIGGASLNPKEFIKIVKSLSKSEKSDKII